eukprot:CAMPEP_0175916352 /NCGR_PEP_ID=MMETSP0108-20121206/10796_1 /TAXON_ID=195067 ORGANISM="Goniomonas pacifica, Strain CCMP1869" /NCGR_SAMPLE_ID=MMETSP0108 /ASSEMBLY_ACC=CAM_ASM_000204 /LENGTH=132 /DNA_ID=CAMNT_0017238889 /DNA_START=386 /DNA_END=784 /DNA_ORIENTATION=-
MPLCEGTYYELDRTLVEGVIPARGDKVALARVLERALLGDFLDPAHPVKFRCLCCRKPGAAFECPRCHSAWYCSADCASVDATSHQAHCRTASYSVEAVSDEPVGAKIVELPDDDDDNNDSTARQQADALSL